MNTEPPSRWTKIEKATDQDDEADIGSEDWISVAQQTKLFSSVFRWARKGGNEGEDYLYFVLDEGDTDIKITPVWDRYLKCFTSFEVDLPILEGYHSGYEFQSLNAAQGLAEEAALTLLHRKIRDFFYNNSDGLKTISEFFPSKG